MVELFRYIEQAFVVPPRPDEVIDVTTDSAFQKGLRDAIARGEDARAIRARADSFLSGQVDAPSAAPLPRAPRYAELRNKLHALESPSESAVQAAVEAVFDDDAHALVGSDAFVAERTLSSDLVVAVKLTTGFDRLDGSSLATTRRVISFLEDFVAGRVALLTALGIRDRLARPLKVPRRLLPAAGAGGRPPEMSRPPADPAAARREDLLQQQAALQGAYETLMRLHPSQLEVRAATTTGRPPAPRRGVADRGEGESASAAAPLMLVVPPRTFEQFDAGVRALIRSELPDTSAVSMLSMVDVVKKRWLEVSREVEPYKLPRPAKTFRLGMHLFAVQEPTVLPKVQAPEPAPLPDFSHAVTRPVGIGILQVVRQELVGYEAADISHIENVMPGELMRRVTRREETNELILTEESETTQSEERDLQSTQRNELSTEAQKEASQQTAATQDQTTTTSYGRLVENSKANYARSVTDRIVHRLTQMVRQQRIRREKKVFSDRAVHELDNKDGEDGVRGIYQWVDKKYRTRILDYGKRLLYDVVVPEPAAFLIDSLERAAQPESFQLKRPSEPAIYPSALNASNYVYWAALYGVTGAVAPPPDEFALSVAHVDSQDVAKAIEAYGASWFGDFFTAFSVRIPDNYRAIGGYVQRTNRNFAFSQPGQAREFEFFIGEQYFLRFGTGDIDLLNSSFSMNGETGEIPVTMRTFSPTIQFNFAVGINCQRTDKALEQWQLETHAAIRAGYQRQRAEYLDQLARYQAESRSQIALAHNFARDASMERQELKKAFIQLLMSEHFGQVPIPTPDPQQLPPDPLHVKKWGAVVAFFERAFEWENLMYVYYPYFWGRRPRWGELILIQDTDPAFQAFLKAGAARVVVPVRPGFEAALAHYHETGDVWMGEEIPDIFGDMYASIVAQIKARNAAPDEEICIAEWDVRLPTTLVVLKEDGKLPEWEPAKPCARPLEE